ncbi:hypothetical protein [Sphingomonas sp.]|uniref:hypothetical protein n=1 Tax=Sphingomonas sp. TaxID=28214 RepID=UPI000DB281F8|nr:hypothetical protein [Sphingomonas sp.]PZU07223.1 MAG: hypothetical protein DI605_16340 [Sphingomonas sp.]
MTGALGQWAIAGITALALVMLLPLTIAGLKDRARRKGRRHFGGQGIDAAFIVFDPARARALQEIEIRKEIGHADEGDRGDPVDGAAPQAKAGGPR